MKCSTSALKSVSHWKEKPMGAALSFLGHKLFASSTLISARFESISCFTSVAAVHPPIVHRTGGFLKKRMTTIYVAAREWAWTATSRLTWAAPAERRPARHLQRYLYWVDAALGTLNWALLFEGAYTGPRLAAWISSNFATAAYSETTNSLSVAYDGNPLSR